MGHCANCGQPDANKFCSRCHIACYCSKGCQISHWRAEHKKVCNKTTASNQAAETSVSSTTTVRPTLYNHLMRKYEEANMANSDARKPSEDDCHYKVTINMCTGTEHVHVEALCGKGGWVNMNIPRGMSREQAETTEWCGSLSNQMMGGAGRALELWIPEVAHLANDDGSYYTEGQLRLDFKEHMQSHFCEGTGMRPNLEAMMQGQIQFDTFECGGKCIALCGDTIYWKFDGDGGRVVTRWETATDDELKERGWLKHGGKLYNYCKQYREDHPRSDDDAK